MPLPCNYPHSVFCLSVTNGQFIARKSFISKVRVKVVMCSACSVWITNHSNIHTVPTNAAWEKVQRDFSTVFASLTDINQPDFVSVHLIYHHSVLSNHCSLSTSAMKQSKKKGFFQLSGFFK